MNYNYNNQNELIFIDNLVTENGSGFLTGHTLPFVEVGIVVDDENTLYTTSDANGNFSFVFSYLATPGRHTIVIFILNCCSIIDCGGCRPNCCNRCNSGCGNRCGNNCSNRCGWNCGNRCGNSCGNNCGSCNNNCGDDRWREKARRRCTEVLYFYVDSICPFPIAAPVITSPVGGSTVTDGDIFITGTAWPGSRVSLCVSPGICTETEVDENGNFFWNYPFELPAGVYTLSATVFLPGTTCVSPTTTITFVVSSIGIVPIPGITFPPEDGIITDSTPLIVGTGVPGYTVQVCLTQYSLCETAVVNAFGGWSLSFPVVLPDGTYLLTASQEDLLGNNSAIITSTFTVNAL